MPRVLLLVRFFRVVPPVPRLMTACFAVTVTTGTIVSLFHDRPGAALVPILVLQLFAASSGFAVPARRGYYDLLLTRGVSRLQFAAVHWAMSVAPGFASWAVIIGIELVARGTTTHVASSSGTAAAMALVSTLPWALTVGLPRFSGAIGWLLVLVTVDTLVPLEQAPSWLRFLMYPPALVGREVFRTESLMIAPGLLVAVGATAAACLWIHRMDVPLEAAQ